VGEVYVIVVEPADTPVTSPVNEPAVAIAGLALVHVPPEGVPARLMVDPTHTELTEELTIEYGALRCTLAVWLVNEVLEVVITQL
jgi:hypothetical protein